MPLVPCMCTNCGAPLEVDNEKEAAICKFCGTAFIVEKAINNYKTINVTMDAKDPKALIAKGKRMLESIYFDKDEMAQLAKDLSCLSEDSFYPEFFAYASGDKDRSRVLLKNATKDEKYELACYLFNGIIRDYNKESFDDVKLNILKNYRDVPYTSMGLDYFHDYIFLLNELKDFFDPDMKTKWEHLCFMADSELDEMTGNIDDIKTAITAIGYAENYTPIVSDEILSLVKEKVSAYAKNASASDFMDLYTLAKITENHSIFSLRLGDITLGYDTLIYKGKEYPLSNALEYYSDSEGMYLLLKLDNDTATVIHNDVAFSYMHQAIVPNLKKESLAFFDKLTSYKSDEIEGRSLKLTYIKGFSYKKSIFESAFKFIGSMIK